MRRISKLVRWWCCDTVLIGLFLMAMAKPRLQANNDHLVLCFKDFLEVFKDGC